MGKPTSPPVSLKLPLQQTLAAYQDALDGLADDTQSLLALLLIRDQVEDVLRQVKEVPIDQAQQLIALDSRLRKDTTNRSLKDTSTWGQSFHPSETYWWWNLEELVAEKEKEKDLLLELLAVTFFVITVVLVTDIIQRLWANAPDNIAIVGSLMLLLVTASPFTKRGRELTQWLLKRIPQLPSNRRAQAMAITAFIALVLVIAGRFLIMPQYARIYNNRGVTALEQDDLTTARHQLQRAAAIDKDFAPSYYNLATIYEEVAQPDEAITLYREAIARNLAFSPAYNNLGRLYLQQGEAQQAIMVLQAGVGRLEDGAGTGETVTRYQLLTHLGQAHFELEQMEMAVSSLQQAAALEQGNDPDFPRARPHYYLALAYETLAYPPETVIAEWEAALSYLTGDDPVDWEPTIRAHLETWRQENS